MYLSVCLCGLICDRFYFYHFSSIKNLHTLSSTTLRLLYLVQISTVQCWALSFLYCLIRPWWTFLLGFTFSYYIPVRGTTLYDRQSLARLWRIFPPVSHYSLRGAVLFHPKLLAETLADCSVGVTSFFAKCGLFLTHRVFDKSPEEFLKMSCHLTVFFFCRARPATTKFS